MADSHGALTTVTSVQTDRRLRSGQWPGRFALGFLALLCGGAFVGLAVEAIGNWQSALAVFDARLLGIVRFTLFQALFSTLLSVVPAVFVARALSRQPNFPGRDLLLRLFAVPLAIPAIVAAFGVLALYGRAGLLAGPLSDMFGNRWPGIYGLSGILIAHVFFNLPLAIRLCLEALQTVPNDHWRLAGQLGMRAGDQWRLIEWPVMRSTLPGVAGLVFMLCVTSFTIVLTLGGGPGATTLEVAIYQSLRFDFDPAGAVSLTLLQLLLTGAIVLALARLGGSFFQSADLSVVRRRHAWPGRVETTCNLALITMAAIFVLGPMVAVVVAGLKADLVRLTSDPAVLRAGLTSLILAFIAATIAVALSWSLLSSRKKVERSRSRHGSFLGTVYDSGAAMILVVPPIVLGAGWFVLFRHVGDVFAIAPLMVIAVNAAMAMPFAVRAVRPAHDAAADRYDRLSASLGIRGVDRLRLIDWPVLRRPLMAGFAFALALSLGDLGVIALFGSDSVQTLPYLLLARLGSYRTADAAGLALMLGVLTFALMIVAGRLGGRT